jgi:hypothetical protein
MERQSISDASGTPQRLSGLSYDEAVAILDKGQAPAAPAGSEPRKPWRRGRVGLVALAVVGAAAGVGLLGQASHRVLDCPVAPSPWRPDCGAVRTADTLGLAAPRGDTLPSPSGAGSGRTADGAIAAESTPRKRSVVARGAAKAQDAALAAVTAPSLPVAGPDEDEGKPAYSLSTASPPPGQTLKDELRQALAPEAAPVQPSPRLIPRLLRPDEPKSPAVADRATVVDRRTVADRAVVAGPIRTSPAARPVPDARPAFDAPAQARLPTVARRRLEPAQQTGEVKVAARTELPAAEALRQPAMPPIRPGAVERTVRVPAGPMPTTGATRAAPAGIEPAPEPRSRLARAGDDPTTRSIRRGVAPRSDEGRDGFPREFAQALREHNRRSATPRPDLDRPGGFPREFLQVLREHNMAYSAEPGGRRSPGW